MVVASNGTPLAGGRGRPSGSGIGFSGNCSLHGGGRSALVEGCNDETGAQMFSQRTWEQEGTHWYVVVKSFLGHGS